MELVREEVVAGLKSGFAIVSFEKADGSMRTMRCTLDHDVLPKMKASKTKRDINEEIISVWDMDKEDWRSFRLDMVTRIDYYPAANAA